MRKLFTGGAVLAVLAVAALWLVWSPAASAQDDPFILRGPGSSIGVTVRDVTNEDAEKAKLAQAIGVIVESVREGGPAEKGGLRSGDIVVDFDQERVRSVQHFRRLVDESAPNRSVPVVVVRGTARQTLSVIPEASGDLRTLLPRSFERDLQRQLGQLRRLPRDFNLRINPDLLPRADARRGGRSLGVSVTPLTSQLADYFGVKEGVLVSAVETGSPAAEAGIRAGDVITAVAGRSVSRAQDITAAIRSVTPGDGVDISVTRDRKALMLKATVPQRNNTVSGRRGLPV